MRYYLGLHVRLQAQISEVLYTRQCRQEGANLSDIHAPTADPRLCLCYEDLRLVYNNMASV